LGMETSRREYGGIVLGRLSDSDELVSVIDESARLEWLHEDEFVAAR
jgi:hypothetical protein